MRAKKTEYLLERQSYSLDILLHLGFTEESIEFFLEQDILTKKSGRFKFDFVGFLYVKGKEFFVCPKYRKNVYEDEMIPKFKKLFQVFNMELIYSKDLYFSNTIGEKIIIDFMKNKYFKEEQKREESDWNAVSWEELIVECENFQDGHPVILEPRTFVKKYMISEEMKQMQKSFISFVISSNPTLIEKLAIPKQLIEAKVIYRDDMLRFFKKELRTNRLYREQKMMKMYVDFLTSGKQEYQFIGTKFFHHIWEKICKQLFQDQSSRFTKIFPKPTYQLNHKKVELKGHIPDIIAVPSNDSCYVLDAKYYNFEKSLPQTEDVTKQLFYGKLCANALPKHVISNGFLFLNEQEEDILRIGQLTYDVFEQKEIKLYSLKDTYILNCFINRININPKMLP